MPDRPAALVTGSTSGIGLACARSLAQAGYDVMINGFGADDAIEQQRAAMETEFAITAKYKGGDLTRPSDCEALVRAAEAAFGRLDVLVNNAGIQHVAPIEAFPPEKWDAIIALNLSASFHTIRTAMSGMKARRYGRIINVASAHALTASPFKSAYVSAKHGVLGLTRTVALEGAEFNIRCNAICPGYVMTPLVANQIPDTMKARGLTRDQVIRDVLLEAQPTKEFVKPEDVGALCVFLASAAANQINGAPLSMDGGWTA